MVPSTGSWLSAYLAPGQLFGWFSSKAFKVLERYKGVPNANAAVLHLSIFVLLAYILA